MTRSLAFLSSAVVFYLAVHLFVAMTWGAGQ